MRSTYCSSNVNHVAQASPEPLSAVGGDVTRTKSCMNFWERKDALSAGRADEAKVAGASEIRNHGVRQRMNATGYNAGAEMAPPAWTAERHAIRHDREAAGTARQSAADRESRDGDITLPPLNQNARRRRALRRSAGVPRPGRLWQQGASRALAALLLVRRRLPDDKPDMSSRRHRDVRLRERGSSTSSWSALSLWSRPCVNSGAA